MASDMDIQWDTGITTGTIIIVNTESMATRIQRKAIIKKIIKEQITKS
jgi:hypothetical protein